MAIVTVPLENLYGHIQRAGESPLWAPELAGGYPLLATGQVGYWYPPHMVLRQFLPGVATLNGSLLLHAALAATGMFVWLRYNGFKNTSAAAAAILLPLAAAFVGKFESLNLVLPFMWAPLILYNLQAFLERRQTRHLLGWVLANVLAILVGHPQMAILLILAEAVAAIVLTAYNWRRWVRLLTLALAGASIVGATAFYWLPIIDNLPETDRAAGTLKANESGMFDNQFTPKAFLGWLLPHPFGHLEAYTGPTNENELSSYYGPAALAVIGLGILVGRRQFPGLWWTALALAVVGLTLSVGGHTPVFGWMVESGFTYFNSPARFFYLTHIAFAIFVGMGFEFCLRYFRPGSDKTLLMSLLVVVTLGPALWVSWHWHDGVPWKFTGTPALALRLQAEPSTVRVVAGTAIAGPVLSRAFDLREWSAICDTCVYRQEFTSTDDTIDGVGILVTGAKSEKGNLMLRLYESNGKLLRTATLATRQIVGNQLNVFHFETVRKLEGRRLYFEVTSDMAKDQAPRLLIYRNPTSQYDPTGRLLRCVGSECDPVAEADAGYELVASSERIDYYAALSPNVPAGFGIGSMQWIGALPLQRVKEYTTPIGTWGDEFGPGARTLINRFATTHIIGLFKANRPEPEIPDSTLIATQPYGDDTLRLYQNNGAFPRVHFARDVRAVHGSLDQVNVLIKTDPNDETTILAEVFEDTAFDTAGNRAEVVQDERTRVAIRTEQERDGFLVLRDTLAKGWMASVDGKPTHIHRVDGIFRGVLVPAGSHQVVFEYKPGWISRAFDIGAASLAALLLVLWISRTRLVQ